VASRYSFQAHPSSLDHAVFHNRLFGVFRAGGRVAARRRKQGRNGVLVKPDRQKKYLPDDAPCFHGRGFIDRNAKLLFFGIRFFNMGEKFIATLAFLCISLKGIEAHK